MEYEEAEKTGKELREDRRRVDEFLELSNQYRVAKSAMIICVLFLLFLMLLFGTGIFSAIMVAASLSSIIRFAKARKAYLEAEEK